MTGPAIVLCEPQLGENIGAVARAMLNCGLTDLRLVNPRDGWPSESARAAASGADVVIDGARVFPSAEDAVADLKLVLATTARPRDMIKPVLAPAEAVTRLGPETGVLFGCERSGLTNDQVALADAVVTFPLNPGFTSLNLAQAVLLIGWEWRQATTLATVPPPLPSPPAARRLMLHLFHHLERELDRTSFFFPPAKRPQMRRNLMSLFSRAGLTEQDVRTLHGVVAALGRKSQARDSGEG
jgi:tRNA/rRNA methyltransferase